MLTDLKRYMQKTIIKSAGETPAGKVLAVMTMYPMTAAIRANIIMSGYPVGTGRTRTYHACTKI
ncbi:hypothetical protein GCM10022289_40270 [Pedobacter jeongneungensis]|uniref:Uncharacterized protein n=1 Tax=Pedobacter jeongneungensis TaxID=947309 RepID=A0ABP8BNL6_9SPHI